MHKRGFRTPFPSRRYSLMLQTPGFRTPFPSRRYIQSYVGRSASQNAISANFDARFERFGLCFPTIKIARANAARGANDPRYLVLLLTFSHREVMTGQTRGSNQPNQRKSLIFKSEINGFGSNMCLLVEFIGKSYQIVTFCVH